MIEKGRKVKLIHKAKLTGFDCFSKLLTEVNYSLSLSYIYHTLKILSKMLVL